MVSEEEGTERWVNAPQVLLLASQHTLSKTFEPVYSFPRAPITNYYKLIGLNQQKFILSPFWRPAV